MHIALWWIRRDLRLDDNEALTAALAQAGAVVPVFIKDPILWREEAGVSPRRSFLSAGLHCLDAQLRRRGAALVLRSGDAAHTLAALCRELSALHTVCGIYAAEDFSPYARRRDAAVMRALPVPLVLCPGQAILHPQQVRKADGAPYTVFTPYAKAWKAALPARLKPALPAPGVIPMPPDVPSEPLPRQETQHTSFPPGEDEACARMDAFCGGENAPLYDYAVGRNFPGEEGTSRLSPYLRFGMLSPRRALAAQEVGRARNPARAEGADIWLNELIWREFYQMILYHYPEVLAGSFRAGLRQLRWQDDVESFAAWCAGRTGYPIVDAAARQLLAEGWVHNRARMIAASFLVKDLLIDWRRGEAWYMSRLLDGDPAANNGGWQWCAGTGTDAAPYFRIFNPGVQSRRYDPAGKYIRRWLPELARVPEAYIHEPQRMPTDVQNTCGCIIGKDYPRPIVEHDWARRRALVFYKGVKE